MELYLEKEFLDNFYTSFDKESIDKIVLDLIINYGNKRVFINYNLNEFEVLKYRNEFFALINNTAPPIPIESLEEHIFNKCNFEQTIIFTDENKKWFKDAENKGALCFSFENYQKKIKNIIDSLHFKIDLSQHFAGWGFLENFKTINYNNLVITDGFILSDKDNQKIADNIIPILKNLIQNKKENINISILTKDLNPIVPNLSESIKEKAKKRHRLLNRVFAKTKSKFSIVVIQNKFDSYVKEFNFHDRNIATNFSLLDCGQGFNLMPHKASNSQIISETIFDKYTYNRLKNIKKIQSEIIEKLKILETSEFIMCPE